MIFRVGLRVEPVEMEELTAWVMRGERAGRRGGMGSEARDEHMLQLWRIDQQWKLQQEVSWRF